MRPPGLWEEFAVTQRQLDGNLPRAFVHALLIWRDVCQVGVRDRVHLTVGLWAAGVLREGGASGTLSALPV